MYAENSELLVDAEFDFQVKMRRPQAEPLRPPRRPPDNRRPPRGPKVGICRRRNKHYF